MSSSSASSTSTFTLPDTSPGISVTHPSSISKDQVLTFPAFKTWLGTLNRSLALQHSSESHPFHAAPYVLRSVEIQAVDFFSSQKPGFLKLKATVTNDAGEHLAGSVFMRGGSVAMLIILTPSDDESASASEDEYVILTLQPRIPAGSLSFTELPAGMIDDSGSFAGAAAKEIEEETGLSIASDDLIDMTQLAAKADSQDDESDERLQAAMYPSPGGSDEFIPLFLARKTLTHAEIEELKGKLTGLREHGEKITLKIVRLEDVWRVAWRDGKTLAALALYHGLKQDGML